MIAEKIMYVCESCADNDPESCGHFHRDELRVTPSGEWMCDNCWEHTDHDDPENIPKWGDLAIPDEYAPSAEKEAEITRLREENKELDLGLREATRKIFDQIAEISRLRRHVHIGPGIE